MLKQNHYSNDGVKAIKLLKSGMNNSRKLFSWCHLKNVTYDFDNAFKNEC